MLHGSSESSDNFLEYAIHHALNDFEVHMVDFKGFGLSSGDRNAHYRIQEHHNQIVSCLEQLNSDLPCFIQAHSMGCLSTTTFLINNPHLKIAGFIAGSPFWGMSSTKNISQARRLIIKALATFLEEIPIYASGSLHTMSHDRHYMMHE